jgi:parallel beta-helix repeat protein
MKGVSALLISLLAYLIFNPATVHADYPGIVYHIRDDATGGDCTKIGGWDWYTKTCTLTTDLINQQIFIDQGDDHTVHITLDGNGHSVSVGNTTGDVYEAGVFVNYHSATIKNLTVYNSTYGIEASSYYTSLTISGNTLTGNTFGVKTWASEFTIIEHNTFADNIWGLWLANYSRNSIVQDNVFTRNGVIAESAPGGIFRNNSIDGMLYLAYSGNYTILQNTIMNGGFVIFQSPDNIVYNNNFINSSYNGIPSPYFHDTNSVSTFNMDLPVGGNYWSNFDEPAEECSDTNNDNICDQPYQFINGPGQDTYPWAKMNGWVTPPVIQVTIDIKPGSDPNCFNNNGQGVIPVAILGSESFDVTQVSPETLQLDGQLVRVVGKGNTQSHFEDIYWDGLNDLIVQIEDVDGTYQQGDATATLSGKTFSGTSIRGTDSICIVP